MDTYTYIYIEGFPLWLLQMMTSLHNLHCHWVSFLLSQLIHIPITLAFYSTDCSNLTLYSQILISKFSKIHSSCCMWGTTELLVIRMAYNYTAATPIVSNDSIKQTFCDQRESCAFTLHGYRHLCTMYVYTVHVHGLLYLPERDIFMWWPSLSNHANVTIHVGP